VCIIGLRFTEETKMKDTSKFATGVGDRIKQARLEAGGMKQRELADLLGVSERSVIAYESGQVVPYRFIRQIEEATGKSAAWMLHGDGVSGNGFKEIQDQMATILDQIKLLRVELSELRSAKH
jgi:transcriptional regulator with XRE-family HTH domain